MNKDAAVHLLYGSVYDYIFGQISDSVPTSSNLKPVKNGSDYCRRLRCIEWARELAKAAKLIGVPDPGYTAPIEKVIESAARFLRFQEEEYFYLLEHSDSGEYLSEEGRRHLRELMKEEGVSPDPSIYRKWP